MLDSLKKQVQMTNPIGKWVVVGLFHKQYDIFWITYNRYIAKLALRFILFFFGAQQPLLNKQCVHYNNKEW